jgi:hypothetical protein
MSADGHGKPRSGAFAHFIASSWTSANAFRRSLGGKWQLPLSGLSWNGHECKVGGGGSAASTQAA